MSRRKATRSRLSQMLTREMVALAVNVQDWQGAVREAGRLLVEGGAVEPHYTEAMIEMVKEIGPYIVIAPGVALPHARPESGARRAGISLLTLDPPVHFGNENNDPVTLVIAFSAPGDEGHLEALRDVARLLEDSERVQMIKAATEIEEVLELIAGFAA
jgi:mannitol/fructose-specific phosphotransferase system IIA component (Ntr-type)